MTAQPPRPLIPDFDSDPERFAANQAATEAARVLQPGGVFVACTSSRYNDPEFAEVLPGWGEPFSFDAETAVDIVAEQFSITEVLRWDAAVVRLPDVAAVRLFLRGRGLSDPAAGQEAARRRCPLGITKRGCLIWAQKARPPTRRLTGE